MLGLADLLMLSLLAAAATAGGSGCKKMLEKPRVEESSKDGLEPEDESEYSRR